MRWLDIALLLMLLPLVAYLVEKHRQRERARIAEYEAWLQREVKKFGTSADLAPLAPRLRQVRENYLAEVKAHRQPAGHKDTLLASARRTVRQKAYFHEEGAFPDRTFEHEDAHSAA